jgi:hypothetical protein
MRAPGKNETHARTQYAHADGISLRVYYIDAFYFIARKELRALTSESHDDLSLGSFAVAATRCMCNYDCC